MTKKNKQVKILCDRIEDLLFNNCVDWEDLIIDITNELKKRWIDNEKKNKKDLKK